MKIVFVHRRGPGQFVHLACHLANTGWQVSFLCETMNVKLPGVRVLRHRTAPVLPATQIPEYHSAVGMNAATTLENLVTQEGAPHIVFGHIGWGSMMFIRDVLPTTPLLGYCEHYYHAEGRDVGFATDAAIPLSKRTHLRLRNAGQLLTLDQLDAGISPTRWQKSAYPAAYQPRIGVCHDGIDVHRCRPDDTARLPLPDGRVLTRETPVITYVARDLEPYRGFPEFMRAAALAATRHPDMLFVIAGGDGVSYGTPAPDGRPWREVMMTETGIDPARIIFLGQIPHDQLVRLFQISRAHVYLTYPFVLSWSVLEAMACGALVIGSQTPPVEEIIRSGKNGLLTEFADTEHLTEQMIEAVDMPDRFIDIRKAARRTIVENFALSHCLDRQTALLERLCKT
ncbi:glycosyltransferase family 4 protein [Thalassospira sp.]|uniref:glycosyltransferase family 4 protein n=1 Tax=Thalassospira sp. TaxID=1912094 RepID=UPI002736524F|nr:glycosyltransferase family 4 protein [Thalassospira sp.]MDP2698141.1 glycosyltransferase family 4 protein [Thalassospira sp.]